MLIAIRHTVLDAKAFWRGAGERIPALPPDLKLHEVVRHPDDSRVLCLWETTSLERLEEFFEGTDACQNEYFEPAVSAIRGPSNYSDHEIAWLQGALPQLEPYVPARRVSRSTAALTNAIKPLIDHLTIGVILLDRDGRPIFVNSAAAALLETRDGLCRGGDGLQADHRAETAALQNLIRRAIGLRHSHPAVAGAIPVSRRSLRRPLSVLVTPITSDNQEAARDRCAVVAIFISDPERKHVPSVDVLQSLYALTPSEAKLVALLASGRSLEHAAGEIGISPNTARWHLRHAFVKTGTKSQSELIRVICTGPALLA